MAQQLEWGYTDDNGPATWSIKYPQAAGSRQSPVDIKTKEASSGGSAPSLLSTYNAVQLKKVTNTGCGWKVEVNGNGSLLKGGPLSENYTLEQFHMHWGCTSERGSEHTVDGKSYAGELHLVHWNSGKYSSFAEAATKDDGLAVLGIFLEVGAANVGLEAVAKLIPKIQFRGDSVAWSGNLDINTLLPVQRAYWTYQGSLTTPPCTESVTWIVFKEPIQVSEKQLVVFRSLRCSTREAEECSSEDLIVNNYRPPLPLGNRELREFGSM